MTTIRGLPATITEIALDDQWVISDTSDPLNKDKKADDSVVVDHFLGRTFNVKHYGAAGDGVTEDQAAILAAFDALEAAGGGIVLFPSGTYITGAILTLNASNAIIRGQGSSSIIKVKNAAGSGVYATLRVVSPNTSTTQIQNVIIENIAFDGNRANQAGAYEHKNIRIVASLDIDEPCNIVVRNVWSYNAYSGVLPTEGGGISVEGAGTVNQPLPPSTDTKDYYRQNILIEGCYCYDNDGWGIGTNWGNGIIIANNTCYNNETMGITVWNTQDTIIANNWCYDNVDMGVNCEISDRITMVGNTCIAKTAGIAAIKIFNGWDITLIGNTCYLDSNYFDYHTITVVCQEGATDSGAGTTFKRRACERITIRGNNIKRVGTGGGYCVRITALIALTNGEIVVAGNQIHDVDTANKCAAIYAENVSFVGNVCSGNFYFDTNDGTLVFSNNTVVADYSTARHVVQFDDVGDVIADGNMIDCVAGVADIWQINSAIGSIVISNNVSTGTCDRYVTATSAGDNVSPVLNGNRHNGVITTGRTANLVQPPAAGAWGRGDILWELSPSAGENIGYVCTSGGTPGTWLGFGPIVQTGNWSPTLRFGGATTGITYTTQVGTWVQIGPIIWISCRIILSSKGSASGEADLTGLPIAVAAASAVGEQSVEMRWFNLATNYINMWAILSNTEVTIRALTVADNDAGAALTEANFNNTSQLSFSMVYRMA